jgi:hypothetical protein
MDNGMFKRVADPKVWMGFGAFAGIVALSTVAGLTAHAVSYTYNRVGKKIVTAIRGK